MAVRKNVGSLEQFLVAEAAHGAMALVGIKDPLAKRLLVKPALNHRGDVRAPGFLHGIGDSIAGEKSSNSVVYGDCE